MNACRWGWLLAGLLAAPLVMGQGKTLQPDQVLWDADAVQGDAATAANALQAAAWTRLHAGDGEAARDLLAAYEGNALLQHWAMHQLLIRLQAGPPMPAAEALLAYAEAQPVRVLRQHEETASTWLLAQFDPAAAAADVRRAWAIAAQRDVFASALAKAAVLPVLPADVDPITQASLIAAIESMPPGDARRLAGNAAKQQVAPAVALALARRSGDRALAEALLQHAAPAVRLAAFEQLLPMFETATRREWLQRLENDADLSSAATLALVPMLVADADGAGELLQRLDDAQRGPSTATALAGLGDALRWIDLLWTEAATARQQRMLLLALTLHDSDAARQRRDELTAVSEVQP